MDVGRPDSHGQRDAVRIDHRMTLRARSAAIRQIQPGRFAPLEAGTVAESNDARDSLSCPPRPDGPAVPGGDASRPRPAASLGVFANRSCRRHRPSLWAASSREGRSSARTRCLSAPAGLGEAVALSLGWACEAEEAAGSPPIVPPRQSLWLWCIPSLAPVIPRQERFY